MTRNTTVDARMSAIEAQMAAILAAVQGQQAAPPAKSAHERKVDGLVKARAVLAANRAAAKGQTAPKATKRQRQTETANGQVVPVGSTIETEFGTMTVRSAEAGIRRVSREEAGKLIVSHPERATFHKVKSVDWIYLSRCGSKNGHANPANLSGGDRSLAYMLGNSVVDRKGTPGQPTPNMILGGCEILSRIRSAGVMPAKYR